MRKSETHSYNEYIETAAKLDLIQSMIETIEYISDEILTDEEYEEMIGVQNSIQDISKSILKKSLRFVTIED